jgi:hypothetical protein
MRLQVVLEDSFLTIAHMVTDKEVVVLIDRGLLDGFAYTSPEIFQALCDDMNCNFTIMRDERYDAVIHMVTAADGAP